MDWIDQKTRIRRMLRDPDGNIWSDGLLKNLFNDVQREIQHKTSLLEDAQAVRIPPLYYQAYIHDWEWTYAAPNTQKRYLALRYNQATTRVFCYRWEPQIEAWLTGDTSDEGYHFTQPWEAFMSGTPGDVVPIYFPQAFDKMKWIGWDSEPIDYIDRKQMQSNDTSWLTHSGKTTHYWRIDETENTFALYPLPSSPVWDDIVSAHEIMTNYVGTYDWEITGDYFSGTGEQLTISGTQNYIFLWEATPQAGLKDDVAMRVCFKYEISGSMVDIGIDDGILFDWEAGTIDGVGGPVVSVSETLYSQDDSGILLDVIPVDDNIFMIFRADPTDIGDGEDESDFPEFLRKYIEYGVLERAYAVNNDGRIESLRDYWAYRKNTGIQMIKRYMEKRMADRNYRLITKGVPGQRTRRQPRLPDEYPAVW